MKKEITQVELILPEEQNGGTKMPVLGYICRALLAFLCTFSTALFISDSLGLTPAVPAIFGLCFLFCAFFAVMGIGKRFFAGGCALLLAALILIAVRTKNIVTVAALCFGALSNALFRHMVSIGYNSMVQYISDLDYTLKQLRLRESDCLDHAFFAICILLAILYCASILKRTHLLPLLMAGCSLATLSLYYGLPQKNGGFAVMIASLCGCVAMAGFDHTYSRRQVLTARFGAPAGLGKSSPLLKAFRRNSAFGGFTGLFTALISMLLLFLPLRVEKSMTDIPAISVPALRLETYLTVLADGGNPDFSSLLFSGAASLDKRSAASSDRNYSGDKIFEVQSETAIPIYLRNWTGIDYRHDSWYSADYEQIEEYKKIFGDGFSSELLTQELLWAMHPNLIGLNETSKLHQHLNLGYITAQVHIKKLAPTANVLFLPSYTDQRQRLLKHGSREKSDTAYSNYYDGIFTGTSYLFADDYSTISYLPLLRDHSFAANLGARMNDFIDQSRTVTLLDEMITAGDSLTSMEKTIRSLILNRTVDLTELDRNEVASADMMRLLGVNSLVYRFLYTMDDTERERALALIDNVPLYADYVHKTYLNLPEGSGQIEALAKDLAAAAPGGDPSLLGYARSYDARHKTVMYVIDYLAQMLYTLTPAEPSTDREYINAIDTFLFDTREGYCVQFASAAVMLLRSMGIPARYAEGYIADTYARTQGDDAAARYTSTVRDYNAHAWIEVYYDYYGWVQYEATSPYYSQMYEGGRSDPIEEVPTDTSPIPEDTGPMDTEPLLPIDPGDPTDPDEREFPIAALLITAAALAIVTVLVLAVRMRIRFCERSREQLVRRAEYPSDQPEGRLKTAARLDRAILRLLAHRGLSPAPGEDHEAFAARVDETLGIFTDVSFAEVSRAMLAGEFGTDITPSQLKLLAGYFEDLYRSLGRDANIFSRIWLKVLFLAY